MLSNSLSLQQGIVIIISSVGLYKCQLIPFHSGGPVNCLDWNEWKDRTLRVCVAVWRHWICYLMNTETLADLKEDTLLHREYGLFKYLWSDNCRHFVGTVQCNTVVGVRALIAYFRFIENLKDFQGM